MNLVNLENIGKAYGHRALLAGVSAGVAAGEAIGLVGRNGAGKTSLFRAICGDIPIGSHNSVWRSGN